MRALATIAIVAVVLPASAWAMDKTSMTRAQAKVAKGEKALAEEDWAKAEKHFREAIATEAVLPSSHLGLGAALVGQKRFDEALAVLAEAEGRFVRYEQELQQAELQTKQIVDAERQAYVDLKSAQRRKAPPQGSNSTAEGGPQSVSQFDGQNLAIADHLVTRRWKMEELDAIPAHVFYLEGIAYLRNGRRTEGVDALETALAIDPQHGLAHYNLAVALFTGGDLARAKEHLDAALVAGVEAHPQFVADVERALKR